MWGTPAAESKKRTARPTTASARDPVTEVLANGSLSSHELTPDQFCARYAPVLDVRFPRVSFGHLHAPRLVGNSGRIHPRPRPQIIGQCGWHSVLY